MAKRPPKITPKVNSGHVSSNFMVEIAVDEHRIFIDAILANDLKTVQRIVGGINVNFSMGSQTLLEFALYNSTTEIFLTLFFGGANINKRLRNGDTMLHRLVRRGSLECPLVLQLGANPNLFNNAGYAPIHLAASNYMACDLLFQMKLKGGDINLPTKNEKVTPLMLTVLFNCLFTFEQLLKAGADITAKNADDQTVWDVIQEMGYFGFEEAYTTYITNKNAKNPVDFGRKSSEADFILTEEMRNCVIDILKCGLRIPPLVHAMAAHDLATVQQLAKTTNLSKITHNSTYLMHALHLSDQTIFRALVAAGASCNQRTASGYTVMHVSVQEHRNEELKMMVELKGDPTVATYDGYTLLHLAALNDNRTIIPYLLEKGCNINSKTKRETYTPLICAAICNANAAFRTLIEAGADTQVRDVAGKTAMDYIVLNSNTELMQFVGK